MKIEKVILKDGSDFVEVAVRKNKLKLTFSLPTKKMRPAPSAANPIADIKIDKELGSEGVTYILKNGESGTIHLDAFREASGDPEFFRELAVYNSTLLLESINEQHQISKKEIAAKLATSVAHIYRIFEPSYYGKTLDQIVKALAVYGYKAELTLRNIKTKVEGSNVIDLDRFRFVDKQTRESFNPQPFKSLNYRSADNGSV